MNNELVSMIRNNDKSFKMISQDGRRGEIFCDEWNGRVYTEISLDRSREKRAYSRVLVEGNAEYHGKDTGARKDAIAAYEQAVARYIAKGWRKR